MRNVHIGIFVAAGGGLFTLQEKTVYYVNKKIWNYWTDAIVFFMCVYVYARGHIYACVHACVHVHVCTVHVEGRGLILGISYYSSSVFFFLETRSLSEAGAHHLSRGAGHWAKMILCSSLPPSFWQGCWIWTRVLMRCMAGATSLALWSLLLSDSMSRLMPLDLKTSNPMLIYGKNQNLTRTYISGTDLIDFRIMLG